jgi:hypothetical protein
MPSTARLLAPHFDDLAAERTGLMALTKYLAVSRGNGQCRRRSADLRLRYCVINRATVAPAAKAAQASTAPLAFAR